MVGEFLDQTSQIGELLSAVADKLVLRRLRSGLLHRRIDSRPNIHDVVGDKWEGLGRMIRITTRVFDRMDTCGIDSRRVRNSECLYETFLFQVIPSSLRFSLALTGIYSHLRYKNRLGSVASTVIDAPQQT